MKVIIAGSRDVKDFQLVSQAIEDSKFNITEVVSGTAYGVDKLGERWAIANSIPIKRFPAPWDDLNHPANEIGTNSFGKRYWKRAGMVRNRDMADYAEALIAIIKNNSPGTTNMIQEAEERFLQVYVKRI